MALAVQRSRKMAVIVIITYTKIARKQVQISFDRNIFCQVIISIRILLYCNQIRLGIDCNCLCCANYILYDMNDTCCL